MSHSGSRNSKANHAEFFTIGECADICEMNSDEIESSILDNQLATFTSDTGERVVRAFDLLVACHRNKGMLPPRLSHYANRVLVVEDEGSMARAIERVLRNAGLTTMLTPDGFQASTVVEMFCPALIILDLQMPNMAGMEVLRHLRSDSRYAYIKIIVVSAAPPEQLEAALEAGADRTLPKPFENEQLLAEVSTLLSFQEKA